MTSSRAFAASNPMGELLPGSLPRVSIVVPCFNAERTIGQCVQACLQQDYANLEILFVDDGSEDATPAILAAHDGITVLAQENNGPAAARNLGWRSSSGEIICFTDSDCIPNPQWVSRVVGAYTDSRTGGVGGSYDIANPENWLARCIHEEIRQRHLGMPRQVDFLGSFNLSYTHTVLEELGGFDESFRKASGEDNDLAYRTKKAGYTLIFDPDNCVAHFHTERFWRYMRQQFWHGYWRIGLYLKQPDMLGGDQYAGMFDFLQLPLSLAAALAWLFSWTGSVVLVLAFALSALVLGGQIPLTFSIVRRTGNVGYSPYALVMATRALFRAVGMMRAFLGCSLTELATLAGAFVHVLHGEEQC